MTRPLALALFVSLLCPPLAAQKIEDSATSVAKTATGAVFEEKIGIDGTLISESYSLTRLTCNTESKRINLMLPINRADSAGQEGSTLLQVDGVWHLSLKAGKKIFDKTVDFVAIPDKISWRDEGAAVTIEHGDRIWKALVSPGGDKLLALTNNFGEYESVSDGPHLRQFEKICGLKR